jgi:quercetin dioxygenase-like cupin family protein
MARPVPSSRALGVHMSRHIGFMRTLAILSVCAMTAAVSVRADTTSGDLPQRQELRRADLATSPDMEVVTSVSEIRKGETVPRHSHHGIETGYVLQGSMVQLPGQAPTMMATGSSFMNLRDVPHAGFTVVGDQPLKLLTVHVVDKHKPLYEWSH